MEQIEYKKKFAFMLFKGEQPILAAQRVFAPDGYNDAAFLLNIASKWPYDEDVIEEYNRLNTVVPPKEELINKMLTRAETASDDDFAKIMKLVLEATGYTGKGKEGDKEKATDKLAELASMILEPETNKSV
jgi:hypothetical protein